MVVILRDDLGHFRLQYFHFSDLIIDALFSGVQHGGFHLEFFFALLNFLAALH